MNKLTLRSLRSLNQNRLFSNSLRKMSTEYNVIIYDFPNSDRSKVRPQHVADIPANVPNPIRSAGAIYQDEAKTKFAGSAFHLVANSKEEVIEFLKKDIYYREGIWDINSVVINPIELLYVYPRKWMVLTNLIIRFKYQDFCLDNCIFHNYQIQMKKVGCNERTEMEKPNKFAIV